MHGNTKIKIVNETLSGFPFDPLINPYPTAFPYGNAVG